MPMTNMKIVIQGGHSLRGNISISGAKNAALPALAAACLTADTVRLHNVPAVEDIKVMTAALRELGAAAEFENNHLQTSLARMQSPTISNEAIRTTRASILLLGPLLTRWGQVKISLPGGCAIGERKINFHLEGLTRMGARLDTEGEHIVARCARSSGLHGVEYRFPQKTVTGTENMLMAAALARGTTVLDNCALEPEIGDLIDLLTAMGGRISGRGGERLEIEGRESLHGAAHTIIPDRIEAGTYILAGCFPGNAVTIENAAAEHVSSLLQTIEAVGIRPVIAGKRITIHGQDSFTACAVVTQPYPGFPTDLQAQLMTLLTQANGQSQIRETIFNDRFKHAQELNKLGAAITLNGDTAAISGPTPLRGAALQATDLRASAALVLGGLIAQGETTIDNAYQLLRGYEAMADKLQKIGAHIKIV